jgi:hypothetical protein
MDDKKSGTPVLLAGVWLCQEFSAKFLANSLWIGRFQHSQALKKTIDLVIQETTPEVQPANVPWLQLPFP